MPANQPLGPRGWHGRGYLPHFDGGHEVPQFVTFRLADSVPRSRLNRWQDELRNHSEPERELELYRLIESFLDAGHGSCHLREPRIARLVEDALLHFDGLRYELHAWAIMPNHVHTLFTPISGRPVSGILWSWKSFTSKQANELLGLNGQFWQEDYFDRYIRDADHFADVIAYIERNPVKAGLCRTPEEWEFGSARLRPLNIEAKAAGTAALHGEIHEPA